MNYFLYLLGYWIAKLLPLKACYALAGFISRMYYIFAGRDKSEMRENLRVVLGEGASTAEIDRHMYDIFRNFAKYLSDFFKFPKFTKKYIDRKIVLNGIERLDRCLKEGKGVVVLSLHLGNWELGGAILGALGYKISGIVLEHKDSRVNNFFIKQRMVNGMRSIPLGASVKNGFRALKRNEILAVVGDKDYTNGGVETLFFGRKAILPKGPAVFSFKTGAPIVICCVRRNPDDTFTMDFDEPIRPLPGRDKTEEVERLMSEYVKLYEDHIRKYLDQWYVFRRIWKPQTKIQ